MHQGLARAWVRNATDPLDWVAAIGDPMQPVVAGLALAASRHGVGVLLGGGTQMLAVQALMQAIARAPETPGFLTQNGYVAEPGDRAAFLAHVAADDLRWKERTRRLGVVLDQ